LNSPTIYKSIHYYIFIIILLIITNSFSQSFKTVIATGEAPGADENAFLNAKMNALRNAIEEAVGMEIYSSTFIYNSILQGDFIKSMSRGFITAEETLEQNIKILQEDISGTPRPVAFFKGKFTIKIPDQSIKPKFTAKAEEVRKVQTLLKKAGIANAS